MHLQGLRGSSGNRAGETKRLPFMSNQKSKYVLKTVKSSICDTTLVLEQDADYP